jgi:hypothetical protein
VPNVHTATDFGYDGGFYAHLYAHHEGNTMKPGRNEACPCGSGKKFKRCCMDQISQQHAALLD